MSDQIWCKSHRADPIAKILADRHYNRQKPESYQFAPPGSCCVLITACLRAFWITSVPKFARHAWPESWVCSAFRSEGAGKASELIKMAMAASVAHYGGVPKAGMVTFINRKFVQPVMVRGVKTYGMTWVKAGFVEVGETKGGLLAFHIGPNDMPEALPALPPPINALPLFGFLR